MMKQESKKRKRIRSDLFYFKYDAQYFLKLIKQFSFKGEPEAVLQEKKKDFGLSNKISSPGEFSQQGNAGWDP